MSGAKERLVVIGGDAAGLSAAAQARRLRDDQPVWIVTGTDDAGTLDAARALEEGALSDKFALAISAGRAVALPEVTP